jgi:hypothetical protein
MLMETPNFFIVNAEKDFIFQEVKNQSYCIPLITYHVSTHFTLKSKQHHKIIVHTNFTAIIISFKPHLIVSR